MDLGPLHYIELCKVGKVRTKTQVSELYAFFLYILVISVPDPLLGFFRGCPFLHRLMAMKLIILMLS